jgi:hypothetical protein
MVLTRFVSTHVKANFAPQHTFHRLGVKLSAHMAVIPKC